MLKRMGTKLVIINLTIAMVFSNAVDVLALRPKAARQTEKRDTDTRKSPFEGPGTPYIEQGSDEDTGFLINELAPILAELTEEGDIVIYPPGAIRGQNTRGAIYGATSSVYFIQYLIDLCSAVSSHRNSSRWVLHFPKGTTIEEIATKLIEATGIGKQTDTRKSPFEGPGTPHKDQEMDKPDKTRISEPRVLVLSNIISLLEGAETGGYNIEHAVLDGSMGGIFNHSERRGRLENKMENMLGNIASLDGRVPDEEINSIWINTLKTTGLSQEEIDTTLEWLDRYRISYRTFDASVLSRLKEDTARRLVNKIINAQLKKVIAYSDKYPILQTVLCVGETKDQYDTKRTQDILGEDLGQILEGISQPEARKINLRVAYEPRWAIGTGLTPTLEEIQPTHRFIKDTSVKLIGAELDVDYGGSLSEKNKEILALADVDGGLIGSAAKTPEAISPVIDEAIIQGERKGKLLNIGMNWKAEDMKTGLSSLKQFVALFATKDLNKVQIAIGTPQVKTVSEVISELKESFKIAETIKTKRRTEAGKKVYYIGEFLDTARDKAVLGGKGAGISRMYNMGLPVPPAFTIPTYICLDYLKDNKFPKGLWETVLENLSRLESDIKKKFGDPKDPLLVSVRSGAPISMPGMMDTVLNVGLTDKSVEGLATATSNPRFAWDAYRRFISLFGNIVMGVAKEEFEHILAEAKKAKGYKEDTEFTAEDLQVLVERYKALIKEKTGNEVPQEPLGQLKLAIEAVFKSWNSERAVNYRRENKIAENMGTAVNVQVMVFGNTGPDSATGVAFTRDPVTGENIFWGSYLVNAQGEDVVAGIRNTKSIEELKKEMPQAYAQLQGIRKTLEKEYRDMQDIEFTIMDGKVYMLQTRSGKRTIAAGLKIAMDMFDEGLATAEQALLLVDAEQLEALFKPTFDVSEKNKAIEEEGRLLYENKESMASPGAAVGKIVFDSKTAKQLGAPKDAGGAGEKVILVRKMTEPDDVPGMVQSQGVLTSEGGKSCHAALVARGKGIPTMVGTGVEINLENKTVKIGDKVFKEGDIISMHTTEGQIFAKELTTIPSEIEQVLKGKIKPKESKLYQRYITLMQWSDEFRKLGVRANADEPEDAALARNLGAEGIGLARTEHMFMGERAPLVSEIILQEDKQRRIELLEKNLLPLQREDFIGIFKAMEGLPVTIRLLDPPLHEFLPSQVELVKEIGKLKETLATVIGKLSTVMASEGYKKWQGSDWRGSPAWGIPKEVEQAERDYFDLRLEEDNLKEQLAEKEKLLNRVEALHEANPMLGLRGVRLGLIYSEIYRMQARAIIEAAIELQSQGTEVKPEIMIPLVAHIKELEISKKEVDEIAQQVMKEKGRQIKYSVGTMIELPRAAVTSGEIAKEAAFFSFGTNDLTQTTYGLSRDDVVRMLDDYIEKLKVFPVDPFGSIDVTGVGRLVRLSVAEGKASNPDLKVGICGEHGGDPKSIEFFNSIEGFTYVSASPYRIPTARLAAAQAAIRKKPKQVVKEEEGSQIVDRATQIQSELISRVLNIEPKEIEGFVSAEADIYVNDGAGALVDFVAGVLDSAKDIQGKALIVGPDFFRRGGVTEALRVVSELSKVVKVVVYGESAQRLKAFIGNPNIVIVSTVHMAAKELEEKYNISPKDIVVLSSSSNYIKEGFIESWHIRQIVAAEDIPATLALAKALKELLGEVATEPFEELLKDMAEAEVIEPRSLEENRQALLAMLEEGQTFTFSEDLKTRKVAEDAEIVRARDKIREFIDKHV